MNFSRAFRGQVQLFLLILLLAPVAETAAQDLEPRRWSHLPTGINVAGVGAGWTDGDILLDPVLLAEDVTFDTQSFGGSYVRTFDWFGKTGRIDFRLPYAAARWEGLVDGVYTSRRQRGFMDPRIRFSWNLLGSPALKGKEFMAYRQKRPVNTIVGLALEVTLPYGEHDETKLLNLGGNRLVLRPQLGVLHQRGKWQYELTGSVFLFDDNNEFWNGNLLEQDPLYFLQGHVIYTIKPGMWTALSGGYAHGGQSTVNGDPKPNEGRTQYLALSLGMPVGATQSMKLTYFAWKSNVRVGSEANTVQLSWSVRWGS